MKTLYIDINVDHIVSPSEDIEVYSYSLIDDYFYFVGEKIAGKYAEEIDLIPLLADYEAESGSTPFTEQWKSLKSILLSKDPQGVYALTLPKEYLTWLKFSANTVYRNIYNDYYKDMQSANIDIDLKDLYDESVALMIGEVCRYLDRNADKGFTHLGFDYSERCSPILKVMVSKTGLKICRVRVICPVGIGNRFGIVDLYGNVVVPFDEFDYIGGFIGNLCLAKKEGYYGLINAQAEVVVPFEYDWMNLTCDDILFARKNEKYGAINRKGEVVIPFCYDNDSMYDLHFYDGLVRFKKNGKVGYVNREGEVVIPFEYDDGVNFSEGLVFVLKEEMWKVLNVRGEIAFKRKFYAEYICGTLKEPNFYGGRALVRTSSFGHIHALINKKGEILSDHVSDTYMESEAWNWNYPFDGELAVIRRNGKYGFVDRNGTVVIPLDLDDVVDPRAPWHSGLAKVKRNGRYGVINTEGRIVLPFCEEGYHLFSKSGRLIKVKLGHLNCKPHNKYGFVDPAKENFLIPPVYASLGEFSEVVNLAAAKKADTNKYGYIDTRGKTIVPFVNDCAGSAAVFIEYDTIH